MGSDWPETLLEDLADEVTVGFVGSMTSEYVEDGIPFFRSKNVSPYRIKWDDVKYVSREFHEKLKKSSLGPGDVVIVRTGKPGTACVVPDEVTEANCSDLVIVRPGPNLDKRFLVYYLNSAAAHHINANLVGAVQQHFNVGAAKKINIPLPPLPEQKAIAHILGTLDDKIELNRRMNATLEGMAQALFKSWFVDFDPVIDNVLRKNLAKHPSPSLSQGERDLAGSAPSGRSGDEGANQEALFEGIPEELLARAEVRRGALRANAEVGMLNAEIHHSSLSTHHSLFPAAFQLTEELGWIPEGWKVGHLVDSVRLTMGQSPSSDHYNKAGNGLPFHQGVTNYGERFPKHEQYSTGGNRFAEEGDVLFSVRAPVGRINIANCRLIIGRGLSALRHKKDYQGFLVYFLKHTFATEDSIGSGTIFNAVNKKEMERIPLIVPPDQIAKAFNSIAASLDEKIANNAEQTDCLTKLRDTLLPELISGELEIKQADQLVKNSP